MFNNFNPYNPYYQQQRFQYQPQPQMYNQDQQNSIYRQSTPQGLQGKVVDNIEVVKAMDIPLDGSTSYFAIADGSAIVTKQLQQDGTSKTIIYKPVEGEEASKLPKYVTVEEFDEAIKKVDNNGIREEIKTIKRQMKDLLEDFDEIKGRKGWFYEFKSETDNSKYIK